VSELEDLAARYNEAWNRHDVDAIVALHAPGMVFENHTAGERAEGTATHQATMRRGDLVAEPTGRRVSWEGLDVIPLEGGRVARKDVYSDSVSILRQLGLL
jgi:SnoaL-like domain